jgi:hypothetical protein
MLEELKDFMPPEDWRKHRSWLNRNRHFSWLNPLAWWQSRNDVIARFLSDPVNEERRRLVDLLLKQDDAPEDFIIDRSDPDRVKFIVLGDTGEGDESQWALGRRCENTGRTRSSWSSAATLSIRQET